VPDSVALVLGVIVLGGGYLLLCRIWPYAACRKCGGTGKHRSPTRGSWRKCRRCKGSGTRLRFGRKLLNKYTSETTDL
jgi:hypothetical protein